MHDGIAPGDASSADLSSLEASVTDLHIEQELLVQGLNETSRASPASLLAQLLQMTLELSEKELEEPSEQLVLNKLIDAPYHVFVLSETGRPIFMSRGLEDHLCGLFALIGVFASRVEEWGDTLQTISSGDVHVYFCHRKPIILCIVSRTEELLAEQLSLVYDQILSSLSKSQLETIYQKKGDNYDLRKLLRGTDKYMESCASWWRDDIALSQTAYRVLPMAPSDREFLSSTMIAQIQAAKLEGLMFGIVLAHRQVAALVRFKKYSLHPRDIHILLNLLSGNSSMQLPEAQTWTPICLPKFSDQGFLYAYISYPWDGYPAGFVFLSIKRDHFTALNQIRNKVVEKLEANSKFMTSFKATIHLPLPFEISKIGAGNDKLWFFVYKNRASKQICISNVKPPVVSEKERLNVKLFAEQVTHFIKRNPSTRCMFMRQPKENILVWVTERFFLHCVFCPFTSPQTATALVDKLLKSLKAHEQRHFILHLPSF